MKGGGRDRVELVVASVPREANVEELDFGEWCETERDRTVAEACAGSAILELQHAKQLEAIEHVMLDEELAEVRLRARGELGQLEGLRLHLY